MVASKGKPWATHLVALLDRTMVEWRDWCWEVGKAGKLEIVMAVQLVN